MLFTKKKKKIQSNPAYTQCILCVSIHGNPDNLWWIILIWASLVAKTVTCQCKRFKRRSFSPWVKKIPWGREQLLTPVFLSGGFHGQRSLAGYGPRGRKGSDITEQLTLRHNQYFSVFSFQWQRYFHFQNACTHTVLGRHWKCFPSSLGKLLHLCCGPSALTLVGHWLTYLHFHSLA